MSSETELPVDGNRAAQYLRELAVPRLCGTEMDRKAADLIEEHFRSVGLTVTREHFEFGTMGRWVTKFLVALLPASLFISLALLDSVPVLSFLCAFGVILLFSYMTRNSSKVSWLGHNWGTKIKSQNVVAVKEPELEERAHLLLGAHYDSKSLARSIYPNHYIMELIFLPVFFASAGFLALIGVLGLIAAFTGFQLPSSVSAVFLWFSVLLSIFFLTYLASGYGNDSAGASDNASGVAVLMELANAFGARSLKNLKVTFVAFGAEELGLLGSNHHFFSNRTAWEKNRTYAISIDMPAAKGKFGYNEKYGVPPRKTDPYLNAEIQEAARQTGIACEKIGFPPGSGSDHMPFHERGVPGTLVGALSKESIKTIHTSKDDLSAVDYDRLGDACRLFYRLVLNMDESLA